MTTILDVRHVDGKVLYRLWDTVSDAYYTEPMTREEFMSRFPSYDARRIALAESRGSDSYTNVDGLDGPWIAESWK